MPSCSKNDVVLVRVPFTDMSGVKVRPAVVIHTPHASQDLIIVTLTSKMTGLQAGEFALTNWAACGLHLLTALKRGIFTIHSSLILKQVGQLVAQDVQQTEQSLRLWLGL